MLPPPSGLSCALTKQVLRQPLQRALQLRLRKLGGLHARSLWGRVWGAAAAQVSMQASGCRHRHNLRCRSKACALGIANAWPTHALLLPVQLLAAPAMHHTALLPAAHLPVGGVEHPHTLHLVEHWVVRGIDRVAAVHIAGDQEGAHALAQDLCLMRAGVAAAGERGGRGRV